MCRLAKYVRERKVTDNSYNFQMLKCYQFPYGGKFRIKTSNVFWEHYLTTYCKLNSYGALPLVFRPEKNVKLGFYMDLDFRSNVDFIIPTSVYFNVAHEFLAGGCRARGIS